MRDLCEFLKASPCAAFAVKSVIEELKSEGFSELSLGETWQLAPGGKYFLKVGQTECVAFRLPAALDKKAGLPPYRIIGAHTDSPCLRIKPNCETIENGYVRLNAEIYGGPIFTTWMDRPLSLVGTVCLKSENPFQPLVKYVDFGEPKLIIPNLAIHMNREVNKGVELNPQRDMLPLAGLAEETEPGFIKRELAKRLNVPEADILDYDLFTYLPEEPVRCGFSGELVSAARLDDLLMVWCALKALCETKPQSINMAFFFDNEEIGSRSIVGADSDVSMVILEKIALSLDHGRARFLEDVSASFIISADVAHAIHPAHPEKHDPVLRTALGKGPVIKLAASGSYVTRSEDYSVFEGLCQKAGVPVQKFTNRSDARGGSTIGPLLAAHIPCRSMDMGIALLAMHSARELCAMADIDYTVRAFSAYYGEI